MNLLVFMLAVGAGNGFDRAAAPLLNLTGAPETAARRYLNLPAGVTPVVNSVHDLGRGGAVVVGFGQEVNGILVFRNEMKVVMTPALEHVATLGSLTTQLRPLGTFRLSAMTVVRNLEPAARPTPHTGDEYEHFEGPSGWLRAKPVYFARKFGIVPAFYVEESAHTMARVVSAVDGAELYAFNMTRDHSYRVWADETAPFLPFDGPQGTGQTPTPLDAGSPPPVVARSFVTLDHATISTNDPWLSPTSPVQTQGNNVFAYADLVAPDGFSPGDVLAEHFDIPFDPQLSPELNADQRKTGVVQAFFTVNVLHDWFYDVGFDEKSGNAQRDNYGRGGRGSDPMLVETQDFGGRNNAEMFTPADGASPRMQLYVWDDRQSVSLTVNGPTPLNFRVIRAAFGPSDYAVSQSLIAAQDADGGTRFACGALANELAIAGHVAFVDRGNCGFVEKALALQNAGAIAVVVANNGQPAPLELPGESAAVTVPIVMLQNGDSTRLKNALIDAPSLTVTLIRRPRIDKDSALDNSIVAHEWGHAITNRLIGDGNGLSNTQGMALGEGWADFHAALMTIRPEDATSPLNPRWSGGFALQSWGGSALVDEAWRAGLRRYPLSTNRAINPLTLKYVENGVALPAGVPVVFGSNGARNAEVHNAGEVWAVTLWDLLVERLNEPSLTFEQARDQMREDLVASYKATPLLPTFLDARDALLAVSFARDPALGARRWALFAARGFGVGASVADADSADNKPTTESTALGGNLVLRSNLTFAKGPVDCDNDGLLDAFETGTLVLTANNLGSDPVSGASVTVSCSEPTAYFPDGNLHLLPTIEPSSNLPIRMPIELGNLLGPRTLSITAVLSVPGHEPQSVTSTFIANADVKDKHTSLDSVEANRSAWVAEVMPADLGLSSMFQRRATSPDNHAWWAPNALTAAQTSLRSPPLHVGSSLKVQFRHRYEFEFDSLEFFDGAVIEMSDDDGATWVDIGVDSSPGYQGAIIGRPESANPLRGRRAFVGRSPGYPEFTTETIELGTRYASKTVLLRFRAGADQWVGARGWDVDDISVEGLTEPPFTAYGLDPNRCDNRMPFVSVKDLMVTEGDTVTLTAQVTDINGDATTVSWSQVDGTPVDLMGDVFVAPTVDAQTVLRFAVTASDGRSSTEPSSLRVTVKDRPRCGCEIDSLSAFTGVVIWLGLRLRRRRQS